MTTVYPVWIAPLFNEYRELDPGPLREAIEALATKLQFPLKKLFRMDGSKRTSHSNAFMYGFLNNKRIVLFDTLIDQSSEDEVCNNGCSGGYDVHTPSQAAGPDPTFAHSQGPQKQQCANMSHSSADSCPLPSPLSIVPHNVCPVRCCPYCRHHVPPAVPWDCARMVCRCCPQGKVPLVCTHQCEPVCWWRRLWHNWWSAASDGGLWMQRLRGPTLSGKCKQAQKCKQPRLPAVLASVPPPPPVPSECLAQRTVRTAFWDPIQSGPGLGPRLIG